MNRLLLALLLLLAPAMASAATPVVKIDTSMGAITIELYPDKAPVTVANFLSYVEDGYFAGTIFHRVIPGFMIQGGGLTPDMHRKPGKPAIKNEADNRLSNRRGTLAMARTNAPHSATSQFFINVKDNTFLDFTSADSRGWGYCVFGRVISGMEIVDAIERVKTGFSKGHQDVPKTPVLIENARIVN